MTCDYLVERQHREFCGHEKVVTGGAPISRRLCAVCPHNTVSITPKPLPQGMVAKARRYLDARDKWAAAGKPRRSNERITEIFTICRACEHFRPTTAGAGACGFCGCHLQEEHGMFNKIAMATEGCPIPNPKWLPEEDREIHEGMPVDEMADALRGPQLAFPPGWEKWPVTRAAHQQLLDEVVANPTPYPAEQFSGRGIVIGAGGAKFFGCAWSCAHVLRSLGCMLPIEFWYLGRYELDPTMQRAAESVGIRCVNAEEIVARLPNPPRILNGWELKPFAVIHSAFEEVLYLDADNVPVRDPSFLFDNAEYQRTGAVFWPDLPPYDRTEWLPAVVWECCGLEFRDEPDFESGQFLIDKRRSWRELQATMHINEHSDWYYFMVFGDKSTYHVGWRKCGSEYAMPPFAAGWDWPAIQQYDFGGQLLFQHACRGKESICSGDALGSLVQHEAVYAAARERRKHWAGEIWSWHDQSPAETELARSLFGIWRYDRIGLGARELELADDGVIARGGARCEKRWTLRVIDGVPTLAIVGEAHKDNEIAMMLLTSDERGVWCGRWHAYEKGPVELTQL